MRKLLSVLLLSLSIGVTAGNPFATHHRRMAKSEATQIRKAPRVTAAAIGKPENFVDEAGDFDDDVRLRYVFTYNAAGERATETVYIREKVDDKWGDERLYTRGTYSYEYDTQKRVKAKTVIYTEENSRFSSYRVEVDYGNEKTDFRKYEGDGFATLTEGWSYYNSGELAGRTVYDGSDRIERQISYSVDGHISEIVKYNGDLAVTVTGSLNDSTFIRHDYGTMTKKAHYRYDPATAKLTLLEADGEYSGYARDEFEYDAFGRLVSWNSYDVCDGDDQVDPQPVDPQLSSRSAAGVGEEQLVESITYEYASDEVYPVNSSWYAVWGFYGPLSKMTNVYVDDDGSEITETMTFSRDNTGKLLAVDYSFNSTDNSVSYPRDLKVEVDNSGHIVKVLDVVDNSQNLYTYTWDGDRCVSDKYSDSYGEETVTYSYDENGSVTIRQGDSYVDITTVASKVNGRFKVRQHKVYSGWTKDIYFVNETQKDDLSFVKPNLLKDLNGFSIDPTIVVQEKDRVVTVLDDGETGEYHSTYGKDVMEDYPWDEEWYCNITPDNYFRVENEDGAFVCYNIKDLPVYVLDSEMRLLKEYEYLDVYEEASPVSPVGRSGGISVPVGNPYRLSVYNYSPEGVLTGKTVGTVDEKGVRTEEIDIEYVYNSELSSIETVISANAGITLDNRNLEMTDGSTFSVYTLAGQTIAAGVSAYEFTSPGVYIVATANGSVKVLIR